MSRAVELVTAGPDDTRAVAAVVASVLRPGDVVGLSGELGAGKTCFVQGAAAALGVHERVTSPSFLLRREYVGDVGILHFDVYRLDSLADVVDVGYDEALDGDRVTFVEWSDAMSPLLPDERLEVQLRYLDGPVGDDGAEPRRLCLGVHGDDWARRLAALEPGLRRWRAGGP